MIYRDWQILHHDSEGLTFMHVEEKLVYTVESIDAQSRPGFVAIFNSDHR